MPYIPFTDEQKVLANSVDLEEFLRMRGEKLERVGREHKLIYYDSSGRHYSITLRGSTWFDHKNQIGGGAIKFMQEFYDMDFQSYSKGRKERIQAARGKRKYAQSLCLTDKTAVYRTGYYIVFRKTAHAL